MPQVIDHHENLFKIGFGYYDLPVLTECHFKIIKEYRRDAELSYFFFLKLKYYNYLLEKLFNIFSEATKELTIGWIIKIYKNYLKFKALNIEKMHWRVNCVV